MKYLVLALAIICGANVFAQRPFGHEQAIHKDSTIFVGWSTYVTLQRSYQSLDDVSLGYTTVGDATSATGKAGETGVVSLGDGGEAILMFDKPIKNGTGPDFAVFENGIAVMGDTTFFLELAFVEVSSDGNRFVRFPARSLTPVNRQIQNGEGNSPNFIHNLAGKYAVNWGNPFDLEDIKDSTGINLQYITHVKIKDVVGSLSNQHATYDVLGNKINDPYPTPFASGGFDLDAVGVINQQLQAAVPKQLNASRFLSQNPVAVNEPVVFNALPQDAVIKLTDTNGRTLAEQTILNQTVTIPANSLTPGIWLVQVQSENLTGWFKLLVY